MQAFTKRGADALVRAGRPGGRPRGAHPTKSSQAEKRSRWC